MEKVLKVYLDKLLDEISKKKTEVKLSRDFEGILDKVRDDLSAIGKNLLSMLFVELKGYVEKNNPDFINNNPQKWQDILDRAEALTEYGLYVAPVDILKEETKITPTYIGAAVLVAGSLLTKVFTKKMKVLPAFALALASGVAYSNYFYEGKEKKQKEVLEEYIDDAYDWIKTALENMYKIFKEAL